MLKKGCLLLLGIICLLAAASCNADDKGNTSSSRAESGVSISSAVSQDTEPAASDNADGTRRLDELKDAAQKTMPFSSSRIERNRNWEQDLIYIKENLPELHDNLYEKVTQQEFQSKIDELTARLGQLSDEEIIVELSRILALVGDEDTLLSYWGDYSFPLRFWVFDGGVYIIGTDKNHDDLLYGRVLQIDGVEIGSVLEQTAAVISHENETQLQMSQTQMLFQVELLYGLGIIKDKSGAEFVVETKDGDVQLCNIFSVYGGQHDLDNLLLSQIIGSSHQRWYDFHFIPEQNAMYFEFNVCEDLIEGEPFTSMSERMFDAMEQQPPEKMIIDLRSNGGGHWGKFTSFLGRFTQYLNNHPELRVYVLTGKNSSFIGARAADQIMSLAPGAVSVGEPTGGVLDSCNVINSFRLSGGDDIWVFYSTKNIEYDVGGKKGSFVPDIIIEPTLKDYQDGNDRVLQYVIED